MGNIFSPFDYSYYEGRRPAHLPALDDVPTFPPEFGFDAPRKERVMKVSEQEMNAARIETKYRDYCSHFLVDLYKCRRDRAPLYGTCKAAAHAYNQCEYEDYVLRLKEYEREKRLRLRQERLEGKAAA